MKSGRKIYRKVRGLDPGKQPGAVQRLRDGGLRSLICYLDSGDCEEDPEGRMNYLLGLALVTAADRWMKAKGKGSIL